MLSNRGKEDLVITGGRFSEDAGGIFRFDGIRPSESAAMVTCSSSTPCSIASGESAALRFFYETTAPGWHTGRIEVDSNAENYPKLQLFVLAKAYPMGQGMMDGGVSGWDAGPRPMEAMGRDGEVTCPDPM